MAAEPGPEPRPADDHEIEVLRRQLEGLPSETSTPTIFAYVQSFDIVLIIISTASSIIAGALNPLLTVIYGLLVRSFQNFANDSVSGPELSAHVSQFTLYYVYLGIAEFVFIYIATVGFYHAGERITRNLRRAYLKAIIRQNIAFFDNLNAGEVTTRITSDMNLIQEGITSKISLSLTAGATFVTAVIISFIEYWKLALILLSTVVAIGGAEFLGAKFAIRYSKESSRSYSSGAAIAEEAIGSIRHVSAYGIQKAMADRYLSHLRDAERSGIKTRLSVAFMIGVMNAVPYLSYGLAFWQGSRYVVTGEMTASGVVTTTMAIIIGSFAVGRVAPNAEAFVRSISSAGTILEAIARRSPQDPFSTDGTQLECVHGDIQLKDVSLVYPSRPDVQVLNKVNIHFPANQTTAIVGASGCGKSSIIGLIERFYEPTQGEVALDGHDISNFNLRWLRQQISYVGQEPILFNTSIHENIRLGLNNMMTTESNITALVIAAAKTANAHDFILSLPQGYQTEVGAKGLHLSGGQRQRICIARSLIRNPKILLLDEATSALDVKSERAVQVALESAAKDRNTVVIAHRLSTIRNADNIIVMSQGSVVEQGQHDELMLQNGLYARLVGTQQILNATAEEAEKEDDLESKIVLPELTTAEKKSDIVQFEEHSFAPRGKNNCEEDNVIGAKPIKPSLWIYAQVVMELNRQEGLLIFGGLVFCIIAGLVIPVQSIFFAESINALSLPSSLNSVLRNRINFWSLMFLIVGIAAFIAWLGQGICFSYSTEHLSRRARHRTFQSILRQDVAFFDEREHSSGALTAFLSTSAIDLTGLSGPVIGALITFIATLTAGIILSLVIGWKLALVCSATIPIVAGCGYVRLKMLALFDGKVRKTHEKAATYASELVTAIRPVASLTLEDHVLEQYSRILATQAAKSLRSILQASTLYAASQSFSFFCAALGFWYGGTLMASHEYNMLQFYICFAALISGSQVAGAVFSYAPDMSKAIHASRDLKVLFDRVPPIDSWDTAQGRRGESCNGYIEMHNVSFSYPLRPERLVLDGFSVSIQPGQYVALVGSSGCGKSTIISLLERFFDPTSGQICVDGQDISQLNINDYRRLISLVSQEPILYEGSIRENLILGVREPVSDEVLVQACKEANIYEFITSLPNGFSTAVGSAGVMLSGGQKQRLAIARALLRNTKILLLDEATSALDSESEKIIQEALDRAARQRTTIAVAHRLSTIQHADLICVLDHGRLVESGTHAELMARQGLYSELVRMQSSESKREG